MIIDIVNKGLNAIVKYIYFWAFGLIVFVTIAFAVYLTLIVPPEISYIMIAFIIPPVLGRLFYHGYDFIEIPQVKK